MTAIEQTDKTLTGNELIDSDHYQFINLLNALDTCSNTEFTGLFRQLHEHTEQHFARENQLMQDSGFTAGTDHKAEHERVLGEFKQFKTRIDKGMISFGRAFVKERLPQWFELHVLTMDTALAAHIKNQQQN